MTSRHRVASALDKVFPHLLILLYSLGVAVIYYHHWPFPNPVVRFRWVRTRSRGHRRLALRKGKQGRPLPACQDWALSHSLSLDVCKT